MSKKYAYIYDLYGGGIGRDLQVLRRLLRRRESANLMLTWCLSPRQRSMCRVSGMIV